MLATNFSDARNNFKKYCDEVSECSEPVIVTRKNKKNVVLISLDEYNNMKENIYIFSNQKYVNGLLESKKQVENGFAKKRNLIELDS